MQGRWNVLGVAFRSHPQLRGRDVVALKVEDTPPHLLLEG